MALPPADLPVRLRRAAFNRALAEGDLAAIGPLLAPGCVLVTGTDSAVLSGRKAQLAAWKAEFAARPRTVYVRTPETVAGSGVEAIAMETGQWQGLCEGQVIAAGSYCAKWRAVNGEWAIEAEIYVTLA